MYTSIYKILIQGVVMAHQFPNAEFFHPNIPDIFYLIATPLAINQHNFNTIHQTEIIVF